MCLWLYLALILHREGCRLLMGLKWFVGLSSGNEAGASVPSDTHLIFKLEQKLSRLLRSVGRLKTTLQGAPSDPGSMVYSAPKR